MLKYKKVKRKIFLLILVFVFFLFFCLFHSKDYEMDYTINDVHILERFDKHGKTYSFLFQYKEKEFFALFPHQYIHLKKLIKEVEVRDNGSTICLLPKASKFTLYPLCIENEELISYHLVEDENLIPSSYKMNISYEEKTYKNINLYSLNHKKYYVWNYDGFVVLSENEQKEINLFQNDLYNIPLAIKVDEDLLIADYNSQYAFNQFYVLNSKNDKVRNLYFDKEISFESFFLGTKENKAYLVDKKNKIEYEIYPKRLRMESVVKNNQGKILKNDKWESIPMNTLVKNDNNFTFQDGTQFKIQEGILYKVQGSYQTKLSEKKVKDIVYIDKDTVYYLVDEKLYYYNDKDGEVLVLSNFEWNFNYKNMIYIF